MRRNNSEQETIADPVVQDGSSGTDVSLVCPIYSVPGIGLDWSREEGDVPEKVRSRLGIPTCLLLWVMRDLETWSRAHGWVTFLTSPEAAL